MAKLLYAIMYKIHLRANNTYAFVLSSQQEVEAYELIETQAILQSIAINI